MPPPASTINEIIPNETRNAKIVPFKRSISGKGPRNINAYDARDAAKTPTTRITYKNPGEIAVANSNPVNAANPTAANQGDS